MGRRPRRASFMPGVYVFPGGALDPEDRRPSGFPEPGPPAARGLGQATRRRYAQFLRAALRETFEETGVLLGNGTGAGPAPGPFSGVWTHYAAAGLAPAFAALRPIARAITPKVSPKRFHGRFFLADGRLARGAPKSGAELEDVRWISLEEFRDLPLTAEITACVLAEALHRRALPTTSQVAEVALFSWVGQGQHARRRRRHGAA